MQGRSVHPREAVVGAVLLIAVGSAAAQEAWKVTKLRTEKVALYDCASGSKKSDYARKDFTDPWPVLGAPTPGGLLPVRVGGKQYCVRPYAVETNKPVAASSECGAMVAAGQPKSAATRGLGDECKR